jgi:hypothetical protein
VHAAPVAEYFALAREPPCRSCGTPLTDHAWHYEMPGLRSRALMHAEHLAEYLAPVA